ncbi:MAG: aminotransferase class I/II-fold pyridoxal phosphate-dependent enzyme [Clostridiales bacterium]|nr:aminotransferase class I/II-fold pyridoxal phosphate-dependent enzyme [Clostridiales bacterium]
MSSYNELSVEELCELKNGLEDKYNKFKSMGLSLDMSRGKPGGIQLNENNKLLDEVCSDSDFYSENGWDVRNYGLPYGIPECQRLFAEIMGVDEKNVVVCGNSSLNIMFDYISQCMTHGTGGCEPWMKQGKVKFLCPVPGYDRHFRILEYFGIEMINIPLLDDGPDMDMIESYVVDSSVKGMICVPKYSNPTGITFSDETVRRIAALKPAAGDFRILWDNAYIVHDLSESPDSLLEIFSECKKHNSEDMIIEVISSSKISYPGAGVAAVAASDSNINEIKKRIAVQTIGPDKINQIRHVRFFGSADGVYAHMKKLAKHMAPRFELVLKIFDEELSGKGIAEWTNPNGGYFINLKVLPGCAGRTVSLCADVGVKLTGAGAAFPYGKDPEDAYIRIAPSYPSEDELQSAMEVLCVCVRLAAVEKILEKREKS